MLITLGLFVGIMIFMVLIAIPVVHHARADNHARACIDNLAVILAAKEHYVLDKDLKRGAAVEFKDLVSGDKPLLKPLPHCPDGGVYKLNAAGEFPSCSCAGHELPMVARKKQKMAAAAASVAPAPGK